MVRNLHHRLPRWHRLVLHFAGVVLLATGIGWLALHYGMGAGIGELPHPLEAWAMRLHGLAAFAALFMLGVLAGSHIPHGWRMSGRQRWAAQRASGLFLCAAGAVLVLSGYLLYYFAPESVRPALGWLHSAVGVVMALVVGFHRKPKLRPTGDRA